MGLHDKMKSAFLQLRNNLFCAESDLIYDSISSDDYNQRFSHLPTPEEIRLSVPNPHGYATGMEDCMLNAGFAIELCIQRAKSEPETFNECRDFAQALYRGMVNCATVHSKRGYVVRGYSPVDNCSCYIESSRDQFTLYVYGLWRFFNSEFVTDQQKEEIKGLLRDVADYAESCMNDASQFNLGRLDGQPGMHLKMIGIKSHEALRLPMFFAAAFDTGHAKRFEDLYNKYFSDALEVSERMRERTKPWWHIELSQMQVSLALCCSVETDEGHCRRMRSLMKTISEIAQRQTLEYHFPRLKDYSGSWQPLAHAWRNAGKFTIQLFEDNSTALYGEKIYLKGEESEEFKETFERIRAPGNMITSMLLADGFTPDMDFAKKFSEAAMVPDYTKHTSGALVNILCAYYLARNRGLL